MPHHTKLFQYSATSATQTKVEQIRYIYIYIYIIYYVIVLHCPHVHHTSALAMLYRFLNCYIIGPGPAWLHYVKLNKQLLYYYYSYSEAATVSI